MNDWWNDVTKGRTKYWKKKVSQCHFVHNEFHTNWSGFCTYLSLRGERPAINRLNHGTALCQ